MMEIVRNEKEVVPIVEVARRIGRGADELSARLRYCAMHGISCPLGFAMPPSRDGGQWAYIIPRRRFERYLAGDDLSRPEGAE